MSENILEKIIKKKIDRVDILKKSINLNTLTEIIYKTIIYINLIIELV